MEQDIKNTMQSEKAANSVIYNENRRDESKKRIFRSITNTTLYVCETWPIIESIRNKVKTV